MTAPVLRADHSQLRSGIFSCSINKQWVDELPLIAEALRQHFGPKLDPLTTTLPPPTDPDRLRYELMKIAPATCGVGCSLPKLHLPTCTVDERKVLLYSLSVIMGYPTATDAHDTVVWPIIFRTTNQENNRAQSANDFVTHSESDTDAEYHTDSTFNAEPERYFFLYVNQAARCGGGLSRIRSNTEVIKYLQNSADGRAATATLRNRLFPFRTPSAFTGARCTASPYTFAPIPTGTKTIRWPPDTLAKGLEDSPDFDTPDVRQAAKQLMHSLEHAPEELAMTLKTTAWCWSIIIEPYTPAPHLETGSARSSESASTARSGPGELTRHSDIHKI